MTPLTRPADRIMLVPELAAELGMSKVAAMPVARKLGKFRAGRWEVPASKVAAYKAERDAAAEAVTG